MQERLRQYPTPPSHGGEPVNEPETLEPSRARAEELHREVMDAIDGVLSVDSRQFNTANVQPTGQ